MTSCLTRMTDAINNQTKKQANAIMMQLLNQQTQIEMTKSILEPTRYQVAA